MLTDKQIEDQQEFERKQIQGGKARLHSNTKKLEEKTYASATVYGSSCVSSILPDLIAFIDSKKENLAASFGGIPKYMQIEIVEPDLEIPGIIAIACMTPTKIDEENDIAF